jgi:isopentenyl-diphosphate delta-isomerase
VGKENDVILVDEHDNEVGTLEKLAAHREGLLHRAFSVFLFDSVDRCLLHRRAEDKYHSGGLWTNACCSHPRPGETTLAAARRRLFEELGITCMLMPAFSFVYRAEFDSGLIEYEYDHVFVGRFDGEPVPDPEEVAAWAWMTRKEIDTALRVRPAQFSYWFRACYEKVQRYKEPIPAAALDTRPHFRLSAV